MVHVAYLAIFPELFPAVTGCAGLHTDGLEIAGELLRIPRFEGLRIIRLAIQCVAVGTGGTRPQKIDMGSVGVSGVGA